MELEGYLKIAQKWWWFITLCTLGAGVTSFAVSSVMPPVYEARLLLMSSQPTNTGLIDYSSLLGGQRVIETYRELLQTPTLLDTVISVLDLPYSPEKLVKHIEVSIIPDTQLLDLRVTDDDAHRAALIANEIALTFMLQRSAEQQMHEIEGYERAVVAQMTDLELAIEETEAEIERMRMSPNLLVQEEMIALQANQSQQRAAYASLLAGYMNIRITKSRLVDVVIAEPAQPPNKPIGPRKMLNTALAAMGGCIVACIVSSLLEYLSDNLEDADDVRNALSLPSLGAIPFVRSWQTTGDTRVQESEPTVAEAFRVLRTNIQFISVDRALVTLLITSSEPGEGKTSTIANLGVVIAQSGRKVLLVDADLRRPKLHRALGVSNSLGLSSLIVDSVEPKECISATDIPDLYVLSGGPVPPNPSELLGSQRMKSLVEDLQSLADIVLFDTPPVLACADAMVLATQVNGVLLVVDSRSTKRKAAQRAVESLCQVGAELVGVVLNAVPMHRGSYYHYGHYQDRDEKRETRRRRRKSP